MSKLQKVLFKLLLEIAEICNENDIEYYLAAGCSLGAIRQGTFLTWDDDVDVFLTNESWQQLRSCIKNSIKANRRLVCYEDSENYNNPVARYVDTDTLMLRKSMMLCPDVCGIAVEIFIMDPMPDEIEFRTKHIHDMKIWAELLTPYSPINEKNLKKSEGFDYKTYKKWERLSRIIGIEKAVEHWRKKFMDNQVDKPDWYCMRWGRSTHVFQKNIIKDKLLDNRTVYFEGYPFPIFCHAERSFREGYGHDWMYLPDGNKRGTHSFISDLDFGNRRKLPYISDEMKNTLVKDFRKRKNLRLSNLDNIEKRDKAFATFYLHSLERKINESLSKMNIKDNDCFFENTTDSTLDSLLLEYVTLYNEEWFFLMNIKPTLEDDVLAILINKYVRSGEYYLLKNIIDTDVKCVNKSKNLIKAVESYNYCVELSMARYDENDTDRVKEMILRAPGICTLDAVRAELWLMYREARSINDWGIVVKYAQESIEKYHNDGELMAFLACGLKGTGESEKAKEMYLKAIENTRNGFITRWCRDIGIDVVDYSNYSNSDCNTGEPAAISYNWDSLLLKIYRRCKKEGILFTLIYSKDNKGSKRSPYTLLMTDEEISKIQKWDNDGIKVLSYANDPEIEDFRRKIMDINTSFFDKDTLKRDSYYGMYIPVMKIEKNVNNMVRRRYSLLLDSCVKRNIAKWMKSGRKLRIISMGLKLFGRLIPKKCMLRFIEEKRKSQFEISSKELLNYNDKHTPLLIDDKVVDNETLGSVETIHVEGVDFDYIDESRINLKDKKDNEIGNFEVWIDPTLPYDKYINGDDKKVLQDVMKLNVKCKKMSHKYDECSWRINKAWRQLINNIKENKKYVYESKQ